MGTICPQKIVHMGKFRVQKKGNSYSAKCYEDHLPRPIKLLHILYICKYLDMNVTNIGMNVG